MDFYNLIEGVGEGREACPYTTHATPTYDEGRPRVLALLLLGGTWAPFLQEVLKGFAAQDYPKDRMDVWIHAKAGQQEREITNFVEEHGDDYSTLELVNDLVFEPQMVKDRCDAVRCAFLVMMEPQVVLEDPTTISSLIASDVSVVGPLLKRRMTGEGGEVNFVLSDDSGEQWDKIIRRRIFKGTLRVQEIRSFQVVRKDVMLDFLLGEKVDHYINTITQPGLYLDRLGYEEGKLHPDLWGLTHNWILWQRRYLHPDLLKIIGKKMVPETVGPHLYYLPFFSERFCQDIIEEVEHFGQWQDKDKDDREEEAHRYTSTNINLSQINYFTQYNLLINTVKKELLDTLYSYRSLGYGNLVFVLKYESTTHYNTFKYHLDGATYTFNIALNNNFTGGGLQYRMGNVNFGEEREIWVNHNRTGWALVQPDRPMHLHHGMPLKSGQRYALISIVDTSDAGCMGGPKWT
ncbi:Procollagen-lysine,2-oxoglutarate 5-dioxygenase 1-like 3 [Homarus americanus]|uniref:Procollagen-lysine,2-oxoglutarate 5-dioxygenase 1-like 3 n=2 Tax=Homarus americanus TaxID=6706 RepID=A0A8J5JPR9_HOMAM|nr:Procollagen-lysine,2-oxoglutarate 5-dioxygenase 1-like 3 [Homarus americanus]